MRATNPVVNSCLHNSRLRCKGCECVAGCAIPCLPPCSGLVPQDTGSPAGAAMAAHCGWAELPSVPAVRPTGATGQSPGQFAAGRTQVNGWPGEVPVGRSGLRLPLGHLTGPHALRQAGLRGGNMDNVSNEDSQGGSLQGRALGKSPGLAARGSGAVPRDRGSKAGVHIPGEG